MLRSSVLLTLLVTLGACSGASPTYAPSYAAPSYAPAPRTVARTPPQAATPPPTTQWPRTLPVSSSAFDLHDLPLADVQARSRSQGRPALLFFTADWCGYCFKLEQLTFSQPRVQQRLRSGFVAVEYDVDQAVGKQLAAQYGARGFPTVLVLDASGGCLGRIVGFKAADEFLQAIAGY